MAMFSAVGNGETAGNRKGACRFWQKAACAHRVTYVRDFPPNGKGYPLPDCERLACAVIRVKPQLLYTRLFNTERAKGQLGNEFPLAAGRTGVS